MTSKSIRFGKSPGYLKFLNYGIMASAGFLMCINIFYTVAGLLKYEYMPMFFAYAIGAIMFFVEASITTIVFSGSFQSTIVNIFNMVDDSLSGLATVVRYAFIIIAVIASCVIIVFLYIFDYTSTYDGLFGPGVPSNAGMIALTLLLNYGNEIAGFIQPLIAHLHREARSAEAINRMNTEPEAILKEHQLRIMIAEAKKATQINGNQPDIDPFAKN